MKIKAVISIILTLVLLFAVLPVSAFAGTLGDVDGSGKIESADARLALRASVGLETLTGDAFTAADADLDKAITSADARLILRASVGLEELSEPEAPAVHPENHIFDTISLTAATKCSFPGCEAQLPSFGDMVNGLKNAENGVNYFTAVFEDISHNDKAELGGTLAGMMGDEENIAITETAYSPLVVNRLITKNNFHTKGEGFVINLENKDIKSIKIEKADTVDFVSALPAKFSDGRTEYDISAIKSYDFPEVYKVTLVIPEETTDITKPASGASVFEKVYTSDYNVMLEEMRKGISSSFDSLANEMAGLEGMLKMKSSGSIKSSLVVEYYVTADNFTPVAAKYSHAFGVVFDIKVTDALSVIKYLTMLQKMTMTSNSYYFFNNNFGM